MRDIIEVYMKDIIKHNEKKLNEDFFEGVDSNLQSRKEERNPLKLLKKFRQKDI